jgi:hypothetical protein
MNIFLNVSVIMFSWKQINHLKLCLKEKHLSENNEYSKIFIYSVTGKHARCAQQFHKHIYLKRIAQLCHFLNHHATIVLFTFSILA